MTENEEDCFPSARRHQKPERKKGEESGPSEFAKAAVMDETARRVWEEIEGKKKILGFKGKKREKG